MTYLVPECFLPFQRTNHSSKLRLQTVTVTATGARLSGNEALTIRTSNGTGGNDTLTGGSGLDQFVFNDLRNDGEGLRLTGVTLTGAISVGDGTGLITGDILLV